MSLHNRLLLRHDMRPAEPHLSGFKESPVLKGRLSIQELVIDHGVGLYVLAVANLSRRILLRSRLDWHLRPHVHPVPWNREANGSSILMAELLRSQFASLEVFDQVVKVIEVAPSTEVADIGVRA